MKHTIKTLLLALLSLNLSLFAADETQPTMKAAGSIIIPKAIFHGATAKEVIAYLNIKSKELDPKKQGVNIALAGAADPKKTVDLDLSNASVLDILRAAAGQAGLELQPSETAILLAPKTK